MEQLTILNKRKEMLEAQRTVITINFELQIEQINQQILQIAEAITKLSTTIN
jgi:hypothetical protein